MMTSQVRDASSVIGIGNPILPRTAAVGELILTVSSFLLIPGGYPPYCPRIRPLLLLAYAQSPAAKYSFQKVCFQNIVNRRFVLVSPANKLEFSLFKE